MSERRTLAGIITRAVALQTLLVGGVIVLAFVGLALERSVSSDEHKASQALLDLASFEFQVLNAETGFRGYAIARQEPFLRPYNDAFPAITTLRPRVLGEVSRSDEPYAHEAFRVIDDWRRNFAIPSLRDFRAGHPEVARGRISAGEGKRRIDRIRLLVGGIRAHEFEDLKKAKDKRRTIGAVLIAILLLALAAGLAGGARAYNVLSRAVVRPMARLAAAAQRIRGGDLTARADVRGAAEVATVAEAFNDMAGEVEQTVENLREVDELKTRFHSTVSHELRTPLTSIGGYLQLLDAGVAGQLSDEQLNYVHVAQRNGDRLTSLIDDLLMLTKFDAGRVEIASEPVDLAQQLRNLREEMAPVAEKGQTRLELHAPDALVVQGDSRRLQQSFANLVSNAIKFNRPGGEVRISAEAMNGEAVVEVSDEGVGIPPAELERIGERFFRASTTTNMPGTGLGLAITREIIERHGGSFEVESEPGKGSNFRIRLPR